MTRANAFIVTGPDAGVISITGNAGQTLDIVDTNFSVVTEDIVRIEHDSDINFMHSVISVANGSSIFISTPGNVLLDMDSLLSAPMG